MERIMIFRRKFVYKKRGAAKTENSSLWGSKIWGIFMILGKFIDL